MTADVGARTAPSGVELARPADGEKPFPSGSLAFQAVGVFAAWLYVACLHLTNDGLWYAGDSARHALNGVFWWDFLAIRPADPKEFALSYYARYPAINPTAYPPLFYILEGIAFRVFGVSPWVAKWLVLGFTLMASLYVMAWLRRWLSPQAGWGGALLALQPGVICWSHAVLLNAPAMAVTTAALYHTRRWFDRPASRHVYLAAGATVAGILTYFPTLVLVPVIFSWFIIEGRWKALRSRRTWALAFLLGLVLIGSVAIASKWAPLHLSFIAPQIRSLLVARRWTYYAIEMRRVLANPTLALAAVAVVATILDRRTRGPAMPVLVWLAAGYIALSYLTERETRFALLLCPATVILAVIGLHALSRWASGRSSSFPLLLAMLLALHAVGAWFVRVPRLEGLREVVAFFAKEAPNEMVFYEGQNQGAFTFYVRANDPHFRRGVVRGSKLLYASAIMPEWRLHERVASPAEVVDVLRRECGCRWLAIERTFEPDTIAAVKFLRRALQGPEFELVKSFPIDAAAGNRVDVYRLRVPVEKPDRLLLPFPVLGEGAAFAVKPIPSEPSQD